MTKIFCKWFAAAFIVTSFHAGFAIAAGEKDHPLLSGMPGYKIDRYKQTEFGSYPDAGLCFCQPNKLCTSATPGFNDAGMFAGEGKVTSIEYYNPQKPAGYVSVYRNYENAIKSLGGRKITSWENVDQAIGVHIFKVIQNNAKTWVILRNQFDDRYELSFVEQKAMQQVVTAGQLAESIQKTGIATLYINFDNNKADLKPDAKPTVDEIVALLKKDNALRISVDGHTDNVGPAPANKTLSEARAQSVMKALVASGIDAKRLQFKGFGSEVPVADNRQEAGRAKNRRVELVKLK